MDPMTGDGDIDTVEEHLTEVARALFAAGTVQGSLQKAVDLAVATVDGCDAAGVAVDRGGTMVPVAYSKDLAARLYELQSVTAEGPCLEALRTGAMVYALDLADDDRWPAFAEAASQVGIRSVLSFPLADRPPSALSLFARLPAAFGATDRAKGVLFATLAGLAVDAAGDRADDLERATNFHQALRTRELIGQAQGILMEREHITADQAFDVLRRASQHLNVKLREIARTVVETGDTPPEG